MIENLLIKSTGDTELDDLFTWAAQQGNKSWGVVG